MLINRLYKSKNTANNNKQIARPEQETNLLFYVPLATTQQTKKKSFREEEPKKMLPLIAGSKRTSIHEEISPIDVSIGSARRTSRGGSFNKESRDGN